MSVNNSTAVFTDLPERMQALVLDGVGFENLAVRSLPIPRPGPHQLLARVDAAGICASLIKLIEQGPEHKLLAGWDINRHPIILGDEGTVTLVSVGDNLATQYQVGERYIVQPAVDHAPINLRDRYREAGRGVEKIAVGYTLPGHLAEYILIGEEILTAQCLRPLPPGDLPYAHAAICEPISCVISGQDHHVHLVQESPSSPRELLKGLKPGGLTVIIGAGVMGRMHVDLALSYRPGTVLALDLVPDRLTQVEAHYSAKARSLGVRLVTANPRETDIQGLVAELSNYQGADDVIVAVGSQPAIQEAQAYLGRGGVLNLFGGLKSGQDLVPFNTGIIHYQEINLTGSSGGSPWDIDRTLELMAQGALDPGSYITRIGALEHAIAFLEMIKAQDIDGKAVVYPHRAADEILQVPSWSASDEAAYLNN